MNAWSYTMQVTVSFLTIISMLMGSVPWASIFVYREPSASPQPLETFSHEDTPETQAEDPPFIVYLPVVMRVYVPPTVYQIDPDNGGSLTSPDGQTTITFAPEAVTQTATVAYESLSQPENLPGQLIGDAFKLTANTANGQPLPHFRSQVTTRTVSGPDGAQWTDYAVTNTVVMTMTYDEADVAGVAESNLQIYTRESGNRWTSLLTIVDTERNVATAPLNHFSDFALLSATTVPSQTTVILDPDHGGVDPGGTVTTPAAYAIEEKVLNLDTALAVRDYLQTCGVNVLMTREDDSTLSDYWRAEFINSHAPSATTTIAFNIVNHEMSNFVGGPLGLADFSKPGDITFTQRLMNGISDTTQLPNDRGVYDARTWGGSGLYLPTHVPTTTYAHVESAYLDSYYDRDNVIDPNLGYIAGGIYNGIVAQLELTACVPFSDTVTDEHLRRTLGVSNPGVRYTAQGVNPVTGNQFQWFRDLFVPGVGLNIDIVRYYNSQSNEVGLFGKGGLVSLI